MGCGCRDNKISNNCFPKVNSTCVKYDGYLPDYSKLEEGCTSIEETTTELYKKQSEILESLDLSELGKNCINYATYKDKDNKLTVKGAFRALEDKLCEKSNSNGNSSTFDLSKYDFKCLTDSCNNTIDSQTKLIQALIDKVCELEVRLNSKNI
ncbi:MAG: hypothetical protein LBM02_10050 [Lachnospiraceae bacterium]|jgi:hypothetical protein|nr:hypothetical protein [Lachnospiraceae bacterium]